MALYKLPLEHPITNEFTARSSDVGQTSQMRDDADVFVHAAWSGVGDRGAVDGNQRATLPSGSSSRYCVGLKRDDCTQ